MSQFMSETFDNWSFSRVSQETVLNKIIPMSNRGQQLKIKTQKIRVEQGDKSATSITPGNRIEVEECPSPTREGLESPYPNESPRRKRNATFITQKRLSQVDVALAELNQYIDEIDVKVAKLIENNEAEFLIAYRNHVKKVRQEMDEIRRKAMSNMDSSMGQAEKIETLEKQLTIFREESLKLFEKVSDREKTIYFLQNKVSQLEAERTHLESSVKNLIKRNKFLEGSRNSELRDQSSHNEGTTKEFQISRPTQELISNENLPFGSNFPFAGSYQLPLKSRPYTTAINSKAPSIRSRNASMQLNRVQKVNFDTPEISQINMKIDQILVDTDKAHIETLKAEIKNILVLSPQVFGQTNERETKTAFPSRRASISNKPSSSLIASKAKANRSEMQEFFYKSIETVRKEITRRRGLKSLNFYKQYSNLSLPEFKKVDFFRILELLVSNDRIIAALHQAVFNESNSLP